MGVSLTLHLSRYVTRNTQDFSKCYCAISVIGDEGCHINLFIDYTASIYVSGKCKHKDIRPCLHVKVHKPAL